MIAVACSYNSCVAGLSCGVKRPILEFGNIRAVNGNIFIKTAILFRACVLGFLFGKSRKRILCGVALFPLFKSGLGVFLCSCKVFVYFFRAECFSVVIFGCRLEENVANAYACVRRLGVSRNCEINDIDGFVILAVDNGFVADFSCVVKELIGNLWNRDSGFFLIVEKRCAVLGVIALFGVGRILLCKSFK